MRLTYALGGLSVALALVSCGSQETATQPPASVRFITGVSGGSFRAIGETLQAEIQKRHPELSIDLLPGSGAVGNVDAVEEGRADIGLAFADVAYLAANGELKGHPRAFEHVVGVAVLQTTPLHIVVAPSEDASNVGQLHEPVGMAGNAATGSAIAARLVLEILARPLAASKIGSPPPEAVPQLLESGKLTAYLQLATPPLAWVQKAIDGRARLLTLPQSQVQQLISAYPFFKPATIGSHQYRGLQQSVQTIGVDSLLICRKELSESVVRDLTSALFDARLAFRPTYGAEFLTVEGAPATSIPLHPGAARFYRERELGR